MRAEEVRKYTCCYSKKNYRMAKRNRARAFKDIMSIPDRANYLDVGCGRGETLDMANHLDRSGVFGVEIVPSLCLRYRVTQASITNLPFADNSMDYVSCYDVLEHLPTEDVETALSELWRVTDKALFITTNDHKSNYLGLDLHLTRKPREWWEEWFHKFGYAAIDRCVFATERDWHWRIEM